MLAISYLYIGMANGKVFEWLSVASDGMDAVCVAVGAARRGGQRPSGLHSRCGGDRAWLRADGVAEGWPAAGLAFMNGLLINVNI